jgi:DNA invertase Pin-like site-specific DNA recombinase
MNTTINEQHLSKTAYVYVRQSTLAQVRHHQESTERQYALRAKALDMGWSEPSVQILDRDLGKSGAQITGREDFKTLVAEVSMGQVGAVFALEVSRLARSNLDWHRLLELCALTDTLVIDEDGCYNPADFNDGLLLGLKGTMAQAELHLLRGRLLGGKLNKARKGELRFPLPVGLCYDEENRIVLDPDEEVQGAVALVFRLFRETGTAFAVVQQFAKAALRFPKRSYGGAWNGKLIWGYLTHSRVLNILKNPSYAGMYVFGRYQYRRQINASGEVRKQMHPASMADWRVSLQEHHDGYINWGEYLKNQERLEKNRTNGGEMILSGPAREGLALLQGLLVCGQCGRALTVRYTGNGGIYPCYQCNSLHRDGLASKGCMSFRCDLLVLPSPRRFCRLCSQQNSSWLSQLSRSWKHGIIPSDASGKCGLNAPSMRPRLRRGATRKSTLRSDWSQPHWNGAGIPRCFTARNSNNRPRSFNASKRELLPRSKKRKSSPWPKICPSYGTPRLHRLKTARECCDCSSRILPSRSLLPSSFSSTSDGGATPVPTSVSSFRPT